MYTNKNKTTLFFFTLRYTPHLLEWIDHRAHVVLSYRFYSLNELFVFSKEKKHLHICRRTLSHHTMFLCYCKDLRFLDFICYICVANATYSSIFLYFALYLVYSSVGIRNLVFIHCHSVVTTTSNA